MKKLLWNKVGTRNAFTIVESIISLMIASMVVLLCGIIINYSLNRRQQENHLTAFHMYLQMLESDEYRFKYVSNELDRLNLTAHHKKYQLSLSNNSIKMTTDHGGYVPLIDGVSRVEWSYHNRILKSKLIMENGDVFNARSLLPKTG